MTPILYEKDEIDFTSQGLGSLVEIYDVDVEEQRNGLLQLTASYPVSGLRYADISVGRIILSKPNQRDDVHAFRIVSTELDISGYAVTIEADSITYDLTHNLVKHLVASGNGQSFMTTLKNAVVNPSIFAFYSDIATSSTTSLDYVNPMEAIMGTTGSFLQTWGGELKRENRRVAMFNRRGRDNVATFRLGKNISGLKYSVDISSLVTRIIPTKSVQNDDQTTTTLEGTPVDSQYINNYEQIYTLPLEFTDDTIETVADLNTAAKGWFTQSANTGRDKPTVTIDIDVLSLQDSADYQDKFKNLESVSLTDTVTVYVPEYGVNVTAIVNELHYDPILDRVTKMTVGTAKQSFADNSRTQLSDLQDKIISVQNQADATAVSADGKSTNYYGSVEPSHPQEGDTWFWVNGDKSGIKVFVNGDWVESVDSDTQEKIAASVTEAVAQANAHTATAIEQNNASQQEVMNDIAKSQADLAIKDGDFNNKAQAMADEALANAKANTATVAQETLDTATDNLNAAKQSLTTDLQAEISDRTNAVAALDIKANGYADQAKQDAIDAATTADGTINKKIDDTATSLTSKITQNQQDADGKITTAQSTATQALNEVSTKVSQTEYNTKTGQLTTDVNSVTETANQSKQDIVSINQKDGDQDARMNSIVSDVNGTKQTVSDLQTKQGEQSGSISTLQQRADGFDATVTKVDNLAIGGRNYFITSTATKGYLADNGVIGSATNHDLTSDFISVSPNDTWIATGRYNSNVSSSPEMVIVFQYYDVNKAVLGARSRNTSGKYVTQYSVTKTIPSGVAYMRVSSGWVNDGYGSFKIEKGNIVTDWSPAPEDVDSATAKAQLTADQATTSLNAYKTDADGRISKAQSDITQTANQVATKVSQNDYNAKTSELSTKVSTAQQTADSAVTTIGAYKTSNDGRITAAETKISQNTNDISLKASQSDLNSATNDYNSKISQININVSSITTSVANNSGNGVRYIRVTSEGNNAGNFNTHVTEIRAINTVGVNVLKGVPVTPINGASNSRGANDATDESYSTYIDLGDMRNSEKFGLFDLGVIRYDLDHIDIAMYGSNRIYYGVNVQYSYDGVVWSTLFKGNIDNTQLISGVVGASLYFGNSGAKIAAQQITINGITNAVSTQGSSINSLTTRVQTAEGTLSTATNNITGLQTNVTQTSNQLAQEIADRTTGDSNTLQSAKDFTTSNITSAVNGVNSTITQTSNGIIAQISGNNMVSNSEFSTDTDWTSKSGTIYLSLGVKDGLDGKYNGQVRVTSTTANSYQGFYHKPIPVFGGGVYSFSAKIHYEMDTNSTSGGRALFDIWFIDKDGNRLSSASAAVTVTNPYWNVVKSENVTAPDTAVYVQINFLVNSTAIGQKAYFGQVMMNRGSKVLPYAPNDDTNTVLSLLKDNWSIGISDNIGNITSGIVGNSNSMSLISDNITLKGTTTVTGEFFARGGSFTNLNASNMTAGTLNASLVNVTNLNASNIVTGTITGASLMIDLTSGQVQFQKGRINSSDYTTDINIDQGYISTANDNTRALIKQGMIQLVAPNSFDLQTSPYMEMSNNRGQSTAGAAIIGRDSVSIANSKNATNIFPAPIGEESFSGFYTGQAFDGAWLPTKVSGADRGVVVAGGTETTWQVVNTSPYIWVGTDATGSSGYGNRVVIKAEYLHATTVYNHGGSTAANVYVASDGAILKSSSATKYKTNIEHETDSVQGDQLLTIDPATWNDKFEAEQLERYHETGVEPERQINMEGKRYYGIIAEDLVKAGLEELVTRNEETDEVEGVEYSKIGVALIPIIRDLRNKLNEQAVEIERLKDKNK
ncbi:MAG: phage tail spike protein [Leuconostoc suionicum]|uniref:phage tail spike protein n=1 Tax=Leuconostoc suionicum TaxID=1511761 RepID=UPI0039EB72BC